MEDKFLDAVEKSLVTIHAREVNIRRRKDIRVSDEIYWLEVIHEPMIHEISKPTPAYAEIARAQYRRERDRAGDPPYSIGNEWLLEFADKCS